MHTGVMNSTLVRTAEVGDLDDLVAMSNGLASSRPARSLDEEQLRRGLLRAVGSSEPPFFVVAENQGKCVGQLLVTEEWSDWNCGWHWWLQSGFIQTELRGQGIFGAMFSYVKDLALERNDVFSIRCYAYQDNIRAHKSFEKVGLRRELVDVFSLQVRQPISSG